MEYNEIAVDFKYILEKNLVQISFFEIISKNGGTLTFTSYSQEDLLGLYEALKKKVNFKGFHENFKALKKIGRGTFASVITNS